MRNIWITGTGGLLGNYLLQTAPATPGTQAIGLSREELDLTDFAAVRRLFCEQNPQLIIHCAAQSKTAACETNPPLAHKLNVDVTALLAELGANIPLIFFSTDLVFDGVKGNYDESASVNPLSVYGETKVAAEKVVLANPRHTVIRTSLNAGTSPKGGRSFNEEMRCAWEAGKTLHLFTDEFRCPIPAVVTARAVWELAARNQPGLYHVAGSESLSRSRIGELLAARWPQLNPKIKSGSLTEHKGAPRALDTSLNCAKAQKLLSFPLPSFTQWLAQNPNEVI